MSFRKLLITLILVPLFNDIILYKGSILITLPKIILFPTLFLVILVLLNSRQIYFSKISKNIIFLVFSLILFSIILNPVFSIYSFSIVQSMITGLIYLICYTSIIIGSDRDNTLSNFIFSLKIINISVLFNGCLGIIQSVSGWGYISDRKFSLYGSLFRAQGLLLDPNYFGQLMLFGLFVSICLYKMTKNYLYAVSSLIALISVFLNGSRSTMLVLIIVTVIILLQTKSIKSIVGLLFSITMVLVVIKLFFMNQVDYFLTIFDASLYSGENGRNSLQDRQELVSLAIQIGSIYWYKGVGIGNFVLFNDYNMFSHNTLAEMFAEYGVFGLISFFYLFIFINIRQFRNLKTSSKLHSNSMKFIIFGIAGYVLMSITLVSYYSKFTFLIFSILIIMDNLFNKRSLNET